MAHYDPALIHKHADRLYRQADRVILLYTVGSATLFWALGYFPGSMMNDAPQNLGYVGLIAGAVGGYAIGAEKAFAYRLQAQIAMCQVKIEENTRKIPSS